MLPPHLFTTRCITSPSLYGLRSTQLHFYKMSHKFFAYNQPIRMELHAYDCSIHFCFHKINLRSFLSTISQSGQSCTSLIGPFTFVFIKCSCIFYLWVTNWNGIAKVLINLFSFASIFCLQLANLDGATRLQLVYSLSPLYTIHKHDQ